MTQASFDLRVGGRVWFDGHGWEVAELTGTVARLSANGVVRTVSITSLAGTQADDADPVDLQHMTWEIPAVVMAGLTSRQQTKLTARVDVLRGVLEPDPDDDRTILARYDTAAASLGVSRRTLQRQAARLLERGPAGLVDARLLQDVRRAVDPRWDAICLEVLSSHVTGSNPTKQSVITRTNRGPTRLREIVEDVTDSVDEGGQALTPGWWVSGVVHPGGQGFRVDVSDFGRGVAVLGPKVWPGQLGGRLRVDSPLVRMTWQAGSGPHNRRVTGCVTGCSSWGWRCGAGHVRCGALVRSVSR